MLYLDLLLLAAVVVFIVDLSGAIDSLKAGIWHFAHGKGSPVPSFRLRPFDCSLCAVWWSTLVVVVVRGRLGFDTVAYCAALAYCSPALAQAIRLVRDGLYVVLNKIEDWINSI